MCWYLLCKALTNWMCGELMIDDAKDMGGSKWYFINRQAMEIQFNFLTEQVSNVLLLSSWLLLLQYWRNTPSGTGFEFGQWTVQGMGKLLWEWIMWMATLYVTKSDVNKKGRDECIETYLQIEMCNCNQKPSSYY